MSEGNGKEALNVEEVKDRVEGDREFFLELVDVFLSDNEEQLGKIATAIEGSDSEALNQLAHCIKSALSNLGANWAADCAFHLERMGREGKLDGAQEIYTELRSSVDAFKTACEEVRSNPTW